MLTEMIVSRNHSERKVRVDMVNARYRDRMVVERLGM
jgi:hypothetical protein